MLWQISQQVRPQARDISRHGRRKVNANLKIHGQHNTVCKLYTVPPPTQLSQDLLTFRHAVLVKKIEQVLAYELDNVNGLVNEITAGYIKKFMCPERHTEFDSLVEHLDFDAFEVSGESTFAQAP